MGIRKTEFGTSENGEIVSDFKLQNSKGIVIHILNYGGIIRSVSTPDKHGNSANIVLGFDDMWDYRKRHPYFGALIGRVGNRIAGGRFTMDGKEYRLQQNDGEHHLHGGLEGFDRKVWDAEITGDQSLKLKCTSQDGEEGYPGTLDVEVQYRLTNENELHIAYQAVTDKKTPVNLTGHSYFNLAGDPSRDILDHQVKLSATHYTPADGTMIPTGEIAHTKGTPFDFSSYKTIGTDLNQVEGGYDHNYMMPAADGTLREMAHVFLPETGRELTVLSTEPGFQFYTGNFLDGSFFSSSGIPFQKHAGFCIEPQHVPDSPNQKTFPSVFLEPGDVYRSETVYRFGVKERDV